MAATPLTVDFADIQGITRFGYRRLTEASFLLLTIHDAAAARSWLATAPISSAVELKQAPTTALQVAFTCEGLKTLGVPANVLAGFSPEFLSGMAGNDARSDLKTSSNILIRNLVAAWSYQCISESRGRAASWFFTTLS